MDFIHKVQYIITDPISTINSIQNIFQPNNISNILNQEENSKNQNKNVQLIWKPDSGNQIPNGHE